MYVHGESFIVNEFGAFGQSAPVATAVEKLQHWLVESGFELGQPDGAYGLNTHAALIRAMQAADVPATHTSTCNTLRLRAKSACADYLRQFLATLGDFYPDDIEEIVHAYRLFLDAYVAKFGDGGEVDPRQIARREGVGLDEAAQIAEAREAAQAEETSMAEAAAIGEPVEGGGTSVVDARIAQARFPWSVVVIFGGLLVGTWLLGRYARKHKRSWSRTQRRGGWRYS